MGGLKFTVSKTGEVLSVTVDMIAMFGLRVSTSIAPILTRMPLPYEHRLWQLISSEASSVFVHPLLMKNYKTRWFRWWIQPTAWGYMLRGSEIASPNREEDIKVYLAHHGRMRVGLVRRKNGNDTRGTEHNAFRQRKS